MRHADTSGKTQHSGLHLCGQAAVRSGSIVAHAALRKLAELGTDFSSYAVLLRVTFIISTPETATASLKAGRLRLEWAGMLNVQIPAT